MTTQKDFTLSELKAWFYEVDMTHRLIDHILEVVGKYGFKSATDRSLINGRYILCRAYLNDLLIHGPVDKPYRLDDELELKGSLDYYINDPNLMKHTRTALTLVAGAYEEMFYKTDYSLDRSVMQALYSKLIDPTSKVIGDYIKKLPDADDTVVYELTYKSAGYDFLLNGVKIRHLQESNPFEEPINKAFEKPGDVKVALFNKVVNSTNFAKDFKGMPIELRSAMFNTGNKVTKMHITTKITNRDIRENNIRKIEVDAYLRSSAEKQR